MIKWPTGTTETFLTGLAVICLLFVVLYGYLVVKDRAVPVFVERVIWFTIGPLVYTLKPKAIG